jgi:hypothetical protein
MIKSTLRAMVNAAVIFGATDPLAVLEHHFISIG